MQEESYFKNSVLTFTLVGDAIYSPSLHEVADYITNSVTYGISWLHTMFLVGERCDNHGNAFWEIQDSYGH